MLFKKETKVFLISLLFYWQFHAEAFIRNIFLCNLDILSIFGLDWTSHLGPVCLEAMEMVFKSVFDVWSNRLIKCLMTTFNIVHKSNLKFLSYYKSFGCNSEMCNHPKYAPPFQNRHRVRVEIKTKEQTTWLCGLYPAVNPLNRREGHPGECLESRS